MLVSSEKSTKTGKGVDSGVRVPGYQHSASKPTFIEPLKRLIARRGRVVRIISDYADNSFQMTDAGTEYENWRLGNSEEGKYTSNEMETMSSSRSAL